MKFSRLVSLGAALLLASAAHAQGYSIDGSAQVTAGSETQQQDPATMPVGIALDRTNTDFGTTRFLSSLEVSPRTYDLQFVANSFIWSTCVSDETCPPGVGSSTASFQGVLQLDVDMLFSLDGVLETSGRDPLSGPVGSTAFRLVGLDNDVNYDFSAQAIGVQNGAAIFERGVLAAGAYQVFIEATQMLSGRDCGGFCGYATAAVNIGLRPVPIPAAALLMMSGLGLISFRRKIPSRDR
jgi:hypothetical protein